MENESKTYIKMLPTHKDTSIKVRPKYLWNEIIGSLVFVMNFISAVYIFKALYSFNFVLALIVSVFLIIVGGEIERYLIYKK